MCVAVCLGALEVHLRNTCQGSSVITSVKREREKGGEEERKSGDRWRNIRGGEGYKKRKERGRIWRGGGMGGTCRVEGSG